jgi:hypothetical protein
MSKVAVALELGELQTLVRVVVCFRGGGRRWHNQEEEEGETGSAARVCEMGGLQRYENSCFFLWPVNFNLSHGCSCRRGEKAGDHRSIP